MGLDDDLINKALKKIVKEKLSEKGFIEDIINELKIEKDSKLIENVTAKLIDKTPEVSNNVINKPIQTQSINDKKSISISIRSILKIATHSLKFANPKLPRNEWSEVFGILGGRSYDYGPKLHIENAYPITHGNLVAVANVFLRDSSKYTKIFYHLKKQSQFICGWYHSHPSHGLFLSPDDIETHFHFQRFWKSSVALVMDPSLINGTSYGFDIYRANKETKKHYSIPHIIEGALNAELLPEILDFLSPIIENKKKFEFDER